MLRQAAARFSRVDGVAACAGDVRTGSVASTPLAAFRDTCETNLVTAFNITQASVKASLCQRQRRAAPQAAPR